AEPFGLSVDDGGSGAAVLTLSGDWVLRPGMPRAEEVFGQLKALNARQIVIDAGQLRRWDDALVNYMMRLKEACDAEGLTLDTSGLPEGVRRLVELALAVPERSGASRSVQRVPFFEAVGRNVLAGAKDARNVITFLGDATLMFGRFLSGRAIYQRRDLWLTIEQCGADALPIVTIISLLVGMILGFVGAIQLEQFGAGIYVADLVGIAMVREMGAIMTGIVLAGRTGAAFAAQIGTMQGNEEIDSLVTLGIPPMDFLVLPRMLALMLMMPLLTIYANVVGIIGGWLVGASVLDLSTIAYFEETQSAVGLNDFFLGIFKSMVFGAVVATAGCLRGLQCGRSAASVGIAATSAVVTGIVYIIAIDGLFAVLTTILGI
ncbi:MAG: ABC transporter permease, partial [Rhodoplanes sp.]